MAVTQQKVDNGTEPSCETAGGDPSTSSIIGPSTRIQETIRGRVKSRKMSRKRKKGNQESLSDIDDSEVAEYLQTKEEVDIKRFLWEAMNKNYSEAKKQTRTTQTKKRAPVEKAAKPTKKVEVQKPSTKVNYAALKFFEDELVNFEL